MIADLRHQLEQQSAEMSRMKIAQNQLETDLQSGQAGRQALLQERSEVTQKFDAAQAKTQSLQDKLDLLERQSSEDKQRATALEAKVTDLNHLLHDREATIDQQQELLAHDRDIRDLMGARDLYVAEVYDVERTGETKKPYGRVFYTKGKSLIFYAYDLDQQAGVKNASTFQAWGRRGPDWQRALNLGIFYVDNSSKKRWVLRFDDPKALAQIDAVFVTVEPNGGSQKPSKKPLAVCLPAHRPKSSLAVRKTDQLPFYRAIQKNIDTNKRGASVDRMNLYESIHNRSGALEIDLSPSPFRAGRASCDYRFCAVDKWDSQWSCLGSIREGNCARRDSNRKRRDGRPIFRTRRTAKASMRLATFPQVPIAFRCRSRDSRR